MLMRLKTGNGAMASRWRRRRPCLILGARSHMAALVEVSGVGALLETEAAFDIGERITLSHPEAGQICAVVDAITVRGVRVAFPASESSMAFALAAITADMSDPAY